MIYTTEWDPAALRHFNKLSWAFAERIDRAVVAFAERGEGELFWDAPYYVLIAGKHNVVLSIEVESRSIAVLQIYRARP